MLVPVETTDILSYATESTIIIQTFSSIETMAFEARLFRKSNWMNMCYLMKLTSIPMFDGRWKNTSYKSKVKNVKGLSRLLLALTSIWYPLKTEHKISIHCKFSRKEKKNLFKENVWGDRLGEVRNVFCLGHRSRVWSDLFLWLAQPVRSLTHHFLTISHKVCLFPVICLCLLTSLPYLARITTLRSQTAARSNTDAAGGSRNLESSCADSPDIQHAGVFYSLSVTPRRVHSSEYHFRTAYVSREFASLKGEGVQKMNWILSFLNAGQLM